MAVVTKSEQMFDFLSSLEYDAMGRRPVGQKNLRFVADMLLNSKADDSLRMKAGRILEFAVRNNEDVGFLGGSLLSVLREKHRILSPIIAQVVTNLIGRETEPARLESWLRTLKDYGVAGNVYTLGVLGRLKLRLEALRSGHRIPAKKIDKLREEYFPAKELKPHKTARDIPSYKRSGRRFASIRHLLS